MSLEVIAMGMERGVKRTLDQAIRTRSCIRMKDYGFNLEIMPMNRRNAEEYRYRRKIKLIETL
jgi:hypothetical protein